jgi:hypothetical protein
MKFISIRQPWALLIVIGTKDVENRTWPTRSREPVLIYASRLPDGLSCDEIERRFRGANVARLAGADIFL